MHAIVGAATQYVEFHEQDCVDIDKISGQRGAMHGLVLVNFAKI